MVTGRLSDWFLVAQDLVCQFLQWDDVSEIATFWQLGPVYVEISACQINRASDMSHPSLCKLFTSIQNLTTFSWPWPGECNKGADKVLLVMMPSKVSCQNFWGTYSILGHSCCYRCKIPAKTWGVMACPKQFCELEDLLSREKTKKKPLGSMMDWNMEMRALNWNCCLWKLVELSNNT